MCYNPIVSRQSPPESPPKTFPAMFDYSLPVEYPAVDYIGGQPQDGELIWFCGSCGDGPIGIWMPACCACNHTRDGCCRVEEK
ncbi:unnamed protein product [Periconia digitata]|uniref:Uncharacterized protein n=1 Tax=Periconia digitata TaxID=1303443 RepID=A0A9W4U7H3_9PLEO|nr:unnamed protein product [Periconia digitata]